MADAHTRSYTAYSTLAEAGQDDDAAVVMQGDEGGTIYLTCPVRFVRCDERTLHTLLLDLDKLDWNEPSSVGLYFEHAPVGTGIAGGTGGGVVAEGVWLHPSLETPDLRESVEAVIAGQRSHI